jgi:hypothetical protein
MHCSAASLGFIFDGSRSPPMFKISSKSTKLSLGMVAPRNLSETPAA